MKLGNFLDFVKNEARSFVLHLLASDPASPVEGQQYHNTTDHHPRYHDGTSFKDLTDALKLGGQDSAFHRARANHTGTQTAATISDFDTQVRTNRLDQMAVPTADVSLNSRKITSLANGTNPQDAATFAQVEAARQGIRSKAAVEAAMTSNVTVSNPGTDTFDGVVLTNGERLLLAGQTTDSESGIHIFNGSGVALTRADDADTFAELDAGTETFVQGGTSNGGKIFRQLTELTGFGGQVWSVVGTGTTYTAGNGLGESPAGTFNVGTASSSRIVVNANDIDLASGIATPGTYRSVTVDTYGRVTGGTNPADRYSALIGDNAATSFTITQATHGRAADQTLVVQVVEVSSNQVIYPTVAVETDGDVVLDFGTAPPTNGIRVTII